MAHSLGRLGQTGPALREGIAQKRGGLRTKRVRESEREREREMIKRERERERGRGRDQSDHIWSCRDPLGN